MCAYKDFLLMWVVIRVCSFPKCAYKKPALICRRKLFLVATCQVTAQAFVYIKLARKYKKLSTKIQSGQNTTEKMRGVCVCVCVNDMRNSGLVIMKEV